MSLIDRNPVTSEKIIMNSPSPGTVSSGSVVDFSELEVVPETSTPVLIDKEVVTEEPPEFIPNPPTPALTGAGGRMLTILGDYAYCVDKNVVDEVVMFNKTTLEVIARGGHGTFCQTSSCTGATYGINDLCTNGTNKIYAAFNQGIMVFQPTGSALNKVFSKNYFQSSTECLQLKYASGSLWLRRPTSIERLDPDTLEVETVFYDTDGFVQENLNLTMGATRATCSNGTHYLSMPPGQYAYLSTDAKNWTSYLLPKTATWQDVIWNGSIFCAVGNYFKLINGSIVYENSIILTSPDGQTWTQRTSANPLGDITNIAWTNGLFCAVFSGEGLYVGETNKCITSPDGINWTLVTLPVTGTWSRIEGNDYSGFCMVSTGIYRLPSSAATTNPPTYHDYVLTSTNGVNWHQYAIGYPGPWTYIVSKQNVLLLGSGFPDRKILRSTNGGMNWTPTDTISVTGFAASDQTFMALSGYGTYISDNGVYWTRINQITNGGPGGGFSVTSDGNDFFANPWSTGGYLYKPDGLGTVDDYTKIDTDGTHLYVNSSVNVHYFKKINSATNEITTYSNFIPNVLHVIINDFAYFTTSKINLTTGVLSNHSLLLNYSQDTNNSFVSKFNNIFTHYLENSSSGQIVTTYGKGTIKVIDSTDDSIVSTITNFEEVYYVSTGGNTGGSIAYKKPTGIGLLSEDKLIISNGTNHFDSHSSGYSVYELQ